MRFNVKAATMVAALAVVLGSTGTAVGASNALEGNSTGYWAPYADRAPLLWWDVSLTGSQPGIDVGVGTAEFSVLAPAATATTGKTLR